MTTQHYTRDEQIQIANTIIQQLGGYGRLKMMTGFKDHYAMESGLQFSISRNHRQINKIRITLNSMDLYDMIFMSVRKKRNSWDFITTVKDEFNGVYADQLPELFEQATGMYLSIPQIQGISA